MLRTMFAGHVSPQVMRALLGGELQIEEKRPAPGGHPAGGGHSRLRRARRALDAVGHDRPVEPLPCRRQPGDPEQRRRRGQVCRRWPDGDLRPAAAAGAPQRNALEAAQDLLLRVERLNANWWPRASSRCRSASASTSGEVLAGYVGSGQRREFSVIGDSVGIAAASRP
jgi:hypothetical protein